MEVISLNITNFRNFASVQTEFSQGVNIFYGDNGSGKTNLLEAIFVFCLGRSQRGAVDTVMLRHNESVFRIEGEVASNDDLIKLAVAYQHGGRKRVTIDGVAIRIAEMYERFCIVSAGPGDSNILAGPPAIRRAFLDIHLSQLSRRYLADLTDYSKALAQKNAALRAGLDPGPFDTLLIRYGSPIVKARQDFIGDLRSDVVEYYAGMSDGGRLGMLYEPSVSLGEDVESVKGIELCFHRRLTQTREKEQAIKTALAGPHRDEVTFEIGGHTARTYGSQGEWRTAAVALKLAVYRLLKQKRRTKPVLLLDEVFAELDEKRSRALVRALTDIGQLFLTTAGEPPGLLFRSGRNFRVQNGQIEAID